VNVRPSRASDSSRSRPSRRRSSAHSDTARREPKARPRRSALARQCVTSHDLGSSSRSSAAAAFLLAARPARDVVVGKRCASGARLRRLGGQAHGVVSVAASARSGVSGGVFGIVPRRRDRGHRRFGTQLSASATNGRHLAAGLRHRRREGDEQRVAQRAIAITIVSSCCARPSRAVSREPRALFGGAASSCGA